MHFIYQQSTLLHFPAQNFNPAFPLTISVAPRWDFSYCTILNTFAYNAYKSHVMKANIL